MTEFSTRLSRITVASVALTILIVFTGCTSTQLPPQQPAPPIPTTTPIESQAPASPEPQAPAEGTRRNPIPADTLTKYTPESVWSFSVGVTDPDAWEIVRAENSFNDPPADGHSYVMAPFYVELSEEFGDEPVDPSWSLKIVYVSSAGNTFGSNSTIDCGFIPAPFFDVGEMYAGANVRFNMCVEVPTTDISGGVWRVSSEADPSYSIFLAGAE